MKFKRIFLIICFLPCVSADIVIDVRTPVEWSEGHLQSSDNIEWQNILSITESVPKNEKIYLYCRSGNKSGKATKLLIDAGYTNVTNAGSMSQAGELLDLKIVKK